MQSPSAERAFGVSHALLIERLSVDV